MVSLVVLFIEIIVGVVGAVVTTAATALVLLFKAVHLLITDPAEFFSAAFLGVCAILTFAFGAVGVLAVIFGAINLFIPGSPRLTCILLIAGGILTANIPRLMDSVLGRFGICIGC